MNSGGRFPPRPDRRGSNSANRSETTQAPLASAGRIVLSRWSTRAAENKSACPAALKSEAKPERIASRKRLGARRTSRLARPNDGKPERGKALFEPPGLNRLAHALAALERDETAPCLRGHWRVGRGAASTRPLAPYEAHRWSFCRRRLEPRRRLFSAWLDVGWQRARIVTVREGVDDWAKRPHCFSFEAGRKGMAQGDKSLQKTVNQARLAS